MKCTLQVDNWYIVLNGCLKFCREQEQEKWLHVGERYTVNSETSLALYCKHVFPQLTYCNLYIW